MWGWIFVAGLAGLGFFFLPQSTSTTSSIDGGTVDVNNLPDVDPQSQGGSWKTDYDATFQTVGQANGVPFALMKAHAIRESALDPNAFRQEPSGKASYGLMQILWWKGSDRFSSYGFPDASIGDGSLLYDPTVNCVCAANIIKSNLKQFGNLRDAINAYNTGVAENTRTAPGNYVNNVISYYEKIIGSKIS